MESKSTVPKQRIKRKSVWKQLGRSLVTSLALLLILAVYSVIGASTFQVLEGSQQAQQKTDIVELRQKIVHELWASKQNSSLSKTKWTALTEQKLQDYEGLLYESFLEGATADSELHSWDFWGSLIYAATVYTTIGYGHIAPTTDEGRIATMVYATLGIPLCLIVLAELGKLLTIIIKLPWVVICGLFKRSEGDTKDQGGNQINEEFNLPLILAVLISAAYIFGGAVMYMQWENWMYLEAIYFIFISVSTVGFGDVLPEYPKHFLASFMYVMLGLSLISMVLNVIMEVEGYTLEKARVMGKDKEEEHPKAD